jgi:nucleoside-diphosphate-sugar epimerase
MKCLVTGGGGFIGSHLSSFLAARGDEVIVLDNFSTGNRDNLQGVEIRLIEGDIRDFSCVAEAVQGVDTVFHQAALCSVARSVEDPRSTHEVNTTGTLNVLEASRRAGVRRMVFASSSSVYGDSETLPKEESMPTAPLSPYAISKLVGEHYAALYSRLFGLETVGLRYFNVFGPRQDPDSEYAAVIPKFLRAILNREQVQVHGDGSQSRDFTYVDNVVHANAAAARASEAAGQVLNIACGKRWSLLELLKRLESEVHSNAAVVFGERRVGDVKHSLASIEKARGLLGYSPAVDFDEGIKRTVAWFMEPASQSLPLSVTRGDHGIPDRAAAGQKAGSAVQSVR